MEILLLGISFRSSRVSGVQILWSPGHEITEEQANDDGYLNIQSKIQKDLIMKMKKLDMVSLTLFQNLSAK